MTNQAEPVAAAVALVLSKDQGTLNLLVESLRPLAMRLQICADSFSAITLLNRQKFEAVIVDLESFEGAALVMNRMHLSPANRTAVSFVITPNRTDAPASKRPDSTFVLERPLTVESICSTFRAAFGMVMRERRRYFRCPVEVTAFVQAQQPEALLCLTINLSEGGMAIRASRLVDQSLAHIRFELPGETGEFLAETKVCWRDESDRVGLEFISIARKAELQDWLARKLYDTLPESVTELFRKKGQTEG